MTKAKNKPDDLNVYGMYLEVLNNKSTILLITFIITAFGFWKASQIPEQGAIVIRPAESTLFSKYQNINATMVASGFEQRFGTETIFEMVQDEFKNKKVLVEILKNRTYVKKATFGMNELNQRLAYFEYAKLFNLERIGIITETQDMSQIIISYTWPDGYDAIAIIQETIQAVIKKVQQNLIEELLVGAEVKELSNQRLLRELEIKLENLAISAEIALDARKIFLIEQAAIAREMKLDNPNTSGDIHFVHDGSLLKLPSLNREYLRGYISIEKEINLLSDRSSRTQLLLTPEYLAIQDTINATKNDTIAKELRDLVNIIKNDTNISKWISYNMLDTPHSKRPVIIILSLFLGLLVGISYTSFRKFFRREKQRLQER